MPETFASSAAPKRRLWSRFTLESRNDMPFLQQMVLRAGGLLAGFLIGTIILVSSGVGPGDLVREFIVAIFTNPRNFSSVLVYAAPLTIVGLAAALAFKAKFWNIGIEGQMILGAMAATAVSLIDLGPPATRLLFMGLAAALGGALWTVVPAFLKAKLDVNEIISTLLLNYVAFNLLLSMLYGPWKDPVSAFPHSQLYESSERFARLGWYDVNASVLLAAALVLAMAWLFYFSRAGYIMNFVNANPDMARAAGVSVAVVMSAAAIGSGALSGVAGFVIASGIDTRLTQSFFVGYLFSGILIAFLARNNPAGVVFFALLVAVLMVAGQTLQVFYRIPFAVVQVIQTIIVICVASSEFFIRHRIRMAK